MNNTFKFAYQFIRSLFADSFEFVKMIVFGIAKVADIVFFKSTGQLKEELDLKKTTEIFLDPNGDQFYKNFQKNINILQGKKVEDN